MHNAEQFLYIFGNECTKDMQDNYIVCLFKSKLHPAKIFFVKIGVYNQRLWNEIEYFMNCFGKFYMVVLHVLAATVAFIFIEPSRFFKQMREMRWTVSLSCCWFNIAISWRVVIQIFKKESLVKTYPNSSLLTIFDILIRSSQLVCLCRQRCSTKYSILHEMEYIKHFDILQDWFALYRWYF